MLSSWAGTGWRPRCRSRTLTCPCEGVDEGSQPGYRELIGDGVRVEPTLHLQADHQGDEQRRQPLLRSRVVSDRSPWEGVGQAATGVLVARRHRGPSPGVTAGVEPELVLEEDPGVAPVGGGIGKVPPQRGPR